MKQINRAQMQGFTLIELMIVIAILGILIAIALPAYQDYTIRTKASECLNVSAAAKLAVAETYQSDGVMPADNAAAGYDFTASSYCESVTIEDGVITATTQSIDGVVITFTLTPGTDDGRLEWTCTSGSAKKSHVPAECR